MSFTATTIFEHIWNEGNIKGIFLKFDHPVYENDTSLFRKGGSREIFQVDSLLNPPWPPFFKGGESFRF